MKFYLRTFFFVVLINCIVYPASAEIYRLAPSDSTLGFSIFAGYISVTGHFEKIEGELHMLPEKETPEKVEITINPKSASLDSGSENGKAIFRGFFNMLPDNPIRFKTSSITKTATGKLQMNGHLTSFENTEALRLGFSTNKSGKIVRLSGLVPKRDLVLLPQFSIPFLSDGFLGSAHFSLVFKARS